MVLYRLIIPWNVALPGRPSPSEGIDLAVIADSLPHLSIVTVEPFCISHPARDAPTEEEKQKAMIAGLAAARPRVPHAAQTNQRRCWCLTKISDARFSNS